MEHQLINRTKEKVQQTAASHLNIHSDQKGRFSLEDNRASSVVQQKQVDKIQGTTIQKKKNNTGLPDNLKSGMENMSGHSLDDVKVHYNSSKPAQLNAHAYAQGTNIHLASGQEKHLAHEAWHVVQQKQGRVQLTKTIAGAKINDNVGLEKEADVMGAKALQRKEIVEKKFDLTKATQVNTSQFKIAAPTSGKIIQRLQKHAIKFIEANNLGIESSSVAVSTYINNTKNPKHLRLGLLRAWNIKQKGMHFIHTPADLHPKSTKFSPMEDLSGWNSDDEDDVDMTTVIGNKEKSKIDLHRTDPTKNKTGVSELSMFDAIRMGRQANKRDDYSNLPFSINLGGKHRIEYDNPGTKDIYATPLHRTGKKDGKTFKRSGTSSDYNWDNLSKNLDRRNYKNPRRVQKRMLRFLLRKGIKIDLDQHIAEAIAAMGSDLMKGSRGGRHYLKKAYRKVKRRKKPYTFSRLFSGTKPIYKPAAEGGRSLVTNKNEELKIEHDANLLLNVNNCLINAISLAAHGAMPNLGQLMNIREQIGSYGDMLFAAPRIITIIRNVLNIQNPITVVYGDRPNENFAGHGNLLTIYHVNGNHFTNIKPK
ncbi:DUF4157 domain-containing protein [Kordia sp.]|uniref:eCIS core domain-containing protein n=1 Tax=Kordia sp. TaxID=1965332 RepID=UPI003D6B7312